MKSYLNWKENSVMSYSRWSNSVWYTYNSSSMENYSRAEQVFTICGVASYTYQELTTNLEACLNDACHKQCYTTPFDDTEVYKEELKPTPEEREELKEYMLKFINNCQKDQELKD